ncbi:hypothetical protein [uncultured Brachyspira sp.]|uniref:hypothetical protein n=1 Tax=uncultured Brachyspira sp. TaxID=221953 RepID=UPI0026216FC9|nr:hypothetical protein [uncultured Brachyspira sp.]
MNTLSLRKSNINILIFFILSAFSLACPIITHHLGFKGTEFLPIFFTLSLGSYILNPLLLILLSVISPVLNYLFTKMPMPPVLYFLIFEGIIFSSAVCLLRKKNISFILIVLLAFILARLSSVILVFIFDININDWFNGIINGYKGIIVNFLLASIMYLILKNNAL